MSGVYNRKLFRKSSARDELRRMGGIMASSEELMAEAMKTAQQAPRPSGLGSMAMPAPQTPMPMQQPMMAQPMMGMPMQQPMMAQPMGMPMQQPMMGQPFMPPQVPQSVQAAPAQAVPGFFAGGLINMLPTMGGSSAASETEQPTSRPNPNRGIGIGPSTVRSVDVSKPAGSYQRENPLPPSVVKRAEELAKKVDEQSPEKTALEILDAAAAEGGPEQTGNTQPDLAAVYESLTGDPAAYEKNIDTLNRGIIGAAIAAGTSARATENIARGMLVGMEGARATEERRAGDARALQLKALEVRAAEQAAIEAEIKAGERAKTEAGAKLAEDVRSAYSRARDSIIESGINNVGKLPEGMTLTQYAESFGRSQAEATYGKEAVDAILGTTAPPASSAPTLEQYMAAVRQHPNNKGRTLTDEQLTESYNRKYGG
jgi:hypothetical protein